MEQIEKISSLCPECLRNISGVKYASDDGKVYIDKECEDHGVFTTLISKDVNHYHQMENFFEVDRASPKNHLGVTEKGCPLDCGLCPSHKQDTCLAVVEVTDRCDMGCTYCFASSLMDDSKDPDMATIRKMFETVKYYSNDPTCVQISGGEPTLREDLPEIIKMGRDLGLTHIELNTNGVRIAQDQEYFDRIIDAGIDALYLGFDGVSDDVYMKRTGKNLFEVKSEVINKCRTAGIGVVLVPLVANNYNLHEVGNIIKFASNNVPTVRGVHFQPVFLSGRSPADQEAKITILDLLENIEEQTNGQLKVEHFTPALMATAQCGATCMTLVEGEGEFLPLTNIEQGSLNTSTDVASKTKKSIMGRWKGSSKNEDNSEAVGSNKCCGNTPLTTVTVPQESSCCRSTTKSNGWAEFIEMSKNRYLTISTMAFQDVWSYEKGRIENCCIHVVTKDGKFVPFCNYNLSSCNGEYLYRDQITT
ncbi:radical SAM protein [Methanosalsum natronophilum]|uniref:radical SAM protein n=1 Tax=Methanosalsum natronophilum TaxID=768733 RepID=UPI0021689601|nr:radical SAM protein [Methanosalsum natronophilum]MCS3923158.1 putative radical SAM superfamily Fe-S cluster-containing enzyme [Methanosalsum natronophilum]